MSQSNNKVGVLLPLVFNKTFDYLIPDGIEAGIGDYVRVPFGTKSVWGAVWGKAVGGIEEKKIKSIETVAAHLSPMNEAMRKFIDWVSWYTLAPAGQVLKMALPVPDALEPAVTIKLQLASGTEYIKPTPSRLRVIAYLSDNIPRTIKEITTNAKVSPGIVREFLKAGGLKEITDYGGHVAASFAPPDLPVAAYDLSPEQETAAAHLHEKLQSGFSVNLLDGVTGSGKTEVYFDTIEQCLKQNKQVLVLLPEIALSVQWLSRFSKRFGFAPDVWHSSVSPARKRKLWCDIAQGSSGVVVGARSALFLPFRNLALIVVDEEHDPSYKQEEGVMYHARDMAVVRARHERIPAVLVSATPSLETEFNINSNRYERIHLPNRHNNAAMPEIRLIDMRKIELPRNRWISAPLKNAIINTLADKNQAMIFMNRRGYAPLMLCRACGHRFQCPHCSAWLVLHRSRGKLLCHHCGHTATLPEHCPDCKAENSLIPYGPGVERIEEELQELFPNARIGAMTSDSMELRVTSRQAGEVLQSKTGDGTSSDIVSSMINGEIDILVGTQMVAKGHHFAGLALVGVIDADMGLAGGDLRAGERTYQLLHQLSGRAGREKTKGIVFLQTYMPEHPVMQALAAGERDNFMLLEANMREDAVMPPYGKLAAIIIEGKDEQQVAGFARELVKTAGLVVGDTPPIILGPAPAPLTRLSGKYRYRILIKAERNFPMQQWLSGWLFRHKIPSSLKLKIDIEPYSFM